MTVDEPVNDLDLEEQVLNVIHVFRSNSKITFILISHNLEHVFDVADRIIVIRKVQFPGSEGSGTISTRT